jgi:hypothetical protein
MVDILTSQAVARVTLLLAVGGSFDPRPAGAANEGGAIAEAHPSAVPSVLLTRASP